MLQWLSLKSDLFVRLDAVPAVLDLRFLSTYPTEQTSFMNGGAITWMHLQHVATLKTADYQG